MSGSLSRILMAEDEPDIREIAVLALETMGGFEVRTVESGAGIVEAARDFKPDMVMLDVMMPDVDGPGALAALRADMEFCSIPVVFMTAKVLTHEVDHLKSLGADAVIGKPFDPMTLAEQLEKIWNGLGD